MSHTELRIRPYQPGDARALTDLFYDTIHSVGLLHYTPEQVAAWAPLPKEYERWAQRLSQWPAWVALLDEVRVGFITLTDSGHIDLAYTHHAYQRQGIATALYEHLLRAVAEQPLNTLTVDASRFARPFFENRGFAVIRENRTVRRGQRLQSWRMALTLLEGCSGS
ncbi:Acetyltransferase, GNAT family [Ferrimonas sediminum]|uniref:Acetyltransferase, GNAT family n=1 Tax=Ferrimonas sediminum TaxID=718193 RepID=A0A1G9BG84_9GAMM|nr:GNAT family N-acetyltransferase [Ferrimonas sediminum]SDK37865.1 Acetyltransferase, GNAT family [Ferrimonas sediminum]